MAVIADIANTPLADMALMISLNPSATAGIRPAIVKTCFNVMSAPESVPPSLADYTQQAGPVQQGEPK